MSQLESNFFTIFLIRLNFIFINYQLTAFFVKDIVIEFIDRIVLFLAFFIDFENYFNA